MKIFKNVGASLLGLVIIAALGYLAWFLYCGYAVVLSSKPAEHLQSFNSAWVYGASQKSYFVGAHVLFVAFVFSFLKLIKKDWFRWHWFIEDVTS